MNDIPVAPRRKPAGFHSIIAFVSKNRFYFTVGAITAAFFLLILSLASMRSFWMDDLCQMDMCWQDSLSDMIERLLLTDNNPPLSHFIGYLWIRIMPYGTVYLKLMNILLTTAGVYIAAVAAGRLGGTRAGIYAALCSVLCGAPLTLFVSYTFRPYGLLFLLSALALYLFVLCRLKGKSALRLTLLSLCLIAMVYTHYFGLLITAAMFFCELAEFIKKKAGIMALIPYAAAAVSFIPWFLLVRAQSMERLSIMNVAPPGLGALVGVTDELTGSRTVTVLLVFAAAALVYKGAKKKNSLRGRAESSVALVPALELLLGIAICRFTPFKTLFLARYNMGILPFITVALGLGADMAVTFISKNRKKGTKRALWSITAAALTVCAFIGCYITIRDNQAGYFEPFEECAEYISKNDDTLSEDALVYCTNYNSQRGMDYYLSHKGKSASEELCWYELSAENLTGKNRVYILELHREFSLADKSLLEQSGFLLSYEHPELPITLYARAAG